MLVCRSILQIHIAAQIERLADLQEDKILTFCKNARATAEEYDFKKLTIKLLDAIGLNEGEE